MSSKCCLVRTLLLECEKFSPPFYGCWLCVILIVIHTYITLKHRYPHCRPQVVTFVTTISFCTERCLTKNKYMLKKDSTNFRQNFFFSFFFKSSDLP